jgi:hypothetical protein
VNIKELAEKIQMCVPKSEFLLLPDEVHEVSQHPEVFIKKVIQFVAE